MERSDQPMEGKPNTYYIDGELLEEVIVEGEAVESDEEDMAGEEGEMEEMAEMEDDGEQGEGMDVIEEEEVDDALYVFREHTDSVYCLAIHPSMPGVIVTGGGDDVAYLWQIPQESVYPGGEFPPTPTPVRLTGHTDTITTVGFNFNGNLLLTGSYDGTVRIWKVALLTAPTASPAAPIQVLEGPSDVEFAAWHMRGNIIIAGSSDMTVWMWVALTGECVRVFAGHSSPVSTGCFSGDGKLIITASDCLRVWATTGVCTASFASAEISCLDVLGDYLASGTLDGTVGLYHVGNGRHLHTFQHSSQVDVDTDTEVFGIECVAFSPSSPPRIASGGADKTLKIWGYSDVAPRCVCQHDGSVVAAKWNKLGMVITASLDRHIRMFDSRDGRCCLKLAGHTDLIINLSLSQIAQQDAAEKDMIVSVGDDHTARVYVVNSSELISA